MEQQPIPRPQERLKQFFDGAGGSMILKLKVHVVGYAEWNISPSKYFQSLSKS